MTIDYSRLTPLQIQVQHDKIRYAESKATKEQFEEDLRNSATRETTSNSGLFGASRNIFQEALTKDTAKMLNLNERKRKFKLEMMKTVDDLNDKEFSKIEGTMIEFNLTR